MPAFLPIRDLGPWPWLILAAGSAVYLAVRAIGWLVARLVG